MTILNEIESVILGSIDSKLERLHIATPGRVESYDETTQKASVKPLIKRGFFDENDQRQVDDLPIVNEVPVCFPGAGSYSITFPIAAGDIVLLIFSDRSLDKWLQGQGQNSDPLDDRICDLNDAVAIPGLRTFSGATDQVDSGALVIAGDSIKLGSKDASDPIIRESDLAALRTYINTHTHSGVTTGGGISGSPSSLLSAITGSNKVSTD